MHQEREYPGPRLGDRAASNPDFAAYARAFGGFGVTVERTADFPTAFEAAQKSGKPAIIHLKIDPEAITPADDAGQDPREGAGGAPARSRRRTSGRCIREVAVSPLLADNDPPLARLLNPDSLVRPTGSRFAPMAYRRTERVLQRLAARHDAIIAAARAIAAEAGIGAVQIAPVAERAGIAAGTVYRYFPAKTDLVAALVDAVSEREIAALRRAADAAPGPLSALAAAIVTFAARALRHRRLAWAVIAEPVDAGGRRRASRLPQGAWRASSRRASAPRSPAVTCPSRTSRCVAAGPGRRAARRPDRSAGAAAGEMPASARASVQMLTLLALRALGVVDARARGLVVQTALPADEDAA